MSYCLTNQRKPAKSLALTHPTWAGVLRLAESNGWKSFSPVYPGQGLTQASWLAGTYLGIPLISSEEDAEGARTLMLTEDALGLADVIELAYQAYEPVRLPVTYFYFAEQVPGSAPATRVRGDGGADRFLPPGRLLDRSVLSKKFKWEQSNKRELFMKQKIVLIGAGSANFGLSTLGDLFRSPVFAGSEICLLDINPVALQRVENFGRNYLEKKNLPFVLSATTQRAEALQGATFCVNSIEVGNRFELWDQDWMIPLQFGIRQVYGENGGPGGLFHSLRIIPPILEICQDIMRICPDAWVLNFSNPMSRICTTVHRKFPELKLVGLCHEIASLPAHLPQILDTPLSNLAFRAGGLNHFSVLKSISYVDFGPRCLCGRIAKSACLL